VGDGSFHAAAAGGGDDEGQLILGSKYGAEEPLNVGGDLEEVGIEMADDGLSQRLIHAWMHLTWTRAKQQSLGRMNGNFFQKGSSVIGTNHCGSPNQQPSSIRRLRP